MLGHGPIGGGPIADDRATSAPPAKQEKPKKGGKGAAK